MMTSKFKSLSEWRKADPKAYHAARRNGMLLEISQMFGWENVKKINVNSEFKVLSNLGLDFDEYLEYKRTTKEK